MKVILSQSGSVRYLLIGVLVILIAMIGAAAWFGYTTFKVPSPEPSGDAVAVRAKIPPPPARMKIPQPQKLEAPESQPQPAIPETRTEEPSQPVVASMTPSATDTELNAESGQDSPPALQTAPSTNAADTASTPDQGPDRDLEISNAGNDQLSEAPSMPPASPQTETPSVVVEEKTAQPPSAPASPELETKAAEPVKAAPEAVATVPEEQKKPAPKPAAAEPEPAPQTSKAETEPQKPAPFTIQVGAYLTKAYAEKKQADLQQRGYEPFIYQTMDKQQRTWHMVRVGHFEDRTAAEMFLSDFTAKENMPAVIALNKRR